MKSSIFQLVSLAWMGASVCANELIRSEPGFDAVGDVSDVADKVATPHIVQFDSEDESEDFCGFGCIKCKTERRFNCHTQCADEGIGNGGHDCRVACRAKIDCGGEDSSADAGPAAGLRVPHVVEFDSENKSADEDFCGFGCIKCKTERRFNCHTQCTKLFGNVGHDCRVACRAKIDCGGEGSSADAGPAAGLRAPRIIQFDSEDESADEDFCGFGCIKCKTERRFNCHTQCADEGWLNGGHDCRVACRAKIDCDAADSSADDGASSADAAGPATGLRATTRTA